VMSWLYELHELAGVADRITEGTNASISGLYLCFSLGASSR
jgi:hypothetical protein